MGTKRRQFPKVDRWGRKRTPYAVICHGPWDMGPNAGHGLVYLIDAEYGRQMDAPNSTWRCPICRYEATWDDDNFEQMVAASPSEVSK